jgi:hypothetical protein
MTELIDAVLSGTPGADLARCALPASQLMPKPPGLAWEEAACSTLCASTSYQMLVSPNGARMKQGDVVLIWGVVTSPAREELARAGLGGQPPADARHAGPGAVRGLPAGRGGRGNPGSPSGPARGQDRDAVPRARPGLGIDDQAARDRVGEQRLGLFPRRLTGHCLRRSPRKRPATR